jgi:hypothetical protein
VSRETQKTVAFLVGTIALGVAAVRYAPKVLGSVAGPEVEMVSLLLRTEKDGLSLSVPGASTPLVAKRHHFDRVTVQTDMVARTAEAASTLDFLGNFGDVEVSSLGVERTLFAYDGTWRATRGLAPRLAAAVGALEARRRALQAGDTAALAKLALPAPSVSDDAELRALLALKERRYDVRAWYLRFDRDTAEVTEQYRLRGVLPDKPVDEEGRRSLTLGRSGAEFFFAKGLM